MTPDDEIDADAKVAALEDLRDELQEKPVKDTRLAGLYEEVSTAPPQLWNRATAFIECEVVSSAEQSSADRSSGLRGGETASSETAEPSPGPREDEANDLDETSGEAASSEPTSEANDLDETSGEAASSEPTSVEEAPDDANGDDESAVRAVVTDVSKLARGWWAPEIVEDCDAMVTVDVRAGLSLDRFVALATDELEESIESIRSDEGDDGGSPL